MSLNIKNPRVHALAREAARRTGQTQTSVIEQALKDFLASLEQPEEEGPGRGRLDALLAEIHADMTDETRDRLRAAQDELYDDDGLPA